MACSAAAACRLTGKSRQIHRIGENTASTEDTPYGPLLDRFEAPLAEGAEPSTIDIPCIRPAALLWKTCNENARFYDLLSAGLALAHICLYFDDVVPGNVHRTDQGRKYMAVYWTILTLPYWILQSQSGWFPLAFVPRKMYKRIRGGISQLCRLLLRLFFAPEVLNFTDGIILQHPLRQDIVFKAKFGCWLADADAIPDISGCKSTSGLKPCGCCRWIVGRRAPSAIRAGSAWVHFTCSDVALWGLWASADLLEMHRFLTLQWAAVIAKRLGVGEFKQLEQTLGYKFRPNGILGSDMALVADLPESVNYDWMHTICSSGGVGQYEINGFLRRILAASRGKARKKAMWAKLDNFREVISFPKREPKKRFSFKERYVTKPNKHVKMFAGEVLQAVVVLGVFCELVLKPDRKLPAEVECFELLVRILYILRAGPLAVRKVLLLNQLVHQHHDRFVALYPGSAKIKVHLLLHIPICIARFGNNLSCFVTERKHRESKQIGCFAFNNWTLTMLRRCLIKHLDRIEDDDWAKPYCLCNAKPIDWGKIMMLTYGLTLKTRPEDFQMEGLSMKTTVGQLFQGDLCLVARDGGIAAGFAEHFLQAADGGCWCLLSFLCPLGGVSYSTQLTRRTSSLIRAEHIVNCVPYIVDGTTLRMLASNDVLTDFVQQAQPSISTG